MVFRKKHIEIDQSLKEEIANAVTHGIGVVFSIVALIAMINQSLAMGVRKNIVACLLYGISLVLLYSVSTLYHIIWHEKAKRTLQLLDHICIYLLIVGTALPIVLLSLEGPTGIIFFTLECLLCIVGITCKLIFGMKRQVLSSTFYLAMGWLAAFIIKPLSAALPVEGMRLVWMGGLCYTLGIIFFATDKKFYYFHTLWHLFVLGGSACHFVVVYQHVIGLGAS